MSGPSLNALVHDPSAELVEAMKRYHRATHVTRSGTLVVPLLEDQDRSAALYPEEWIDDGDRGIFRYRPRYSRGTVRTVHRFPEALAEADYQLKLEEAEVNLRGSYCQVTAGPDGQRLRPYRRESDRWSMGVPCHPSSSVFSAPGLGVLRLDASQARRHGTLYIRRYAVSVEAGLVTVTHEQLYGVKSPQLAFHKLTDLTELPGHLSEWQPVLAAMYDRMECESHHCDGHFHLDRVVGSPSCHLATETRGFPGSLESFESCREAAPDPLVV